MIERISKQAMFMGMAEIAQQRATCRRTRVGAVITDLSGTSVVSIGYNGNARRLSNGCDHTQTCYYCDHGDIPTSAGFHLVGNDIVTDLLTYKPCLRQVPVPGDCGCIHAEANALIKAPFHQGPLVMYTTLSPCRDCAKLIINSAVTRVFYSELYRDPAGILLLEQGGINSESLSPELRKEQLEFIP